MKDDEPFDTDRSASHIETLQGTTHTIAEFGALPLRCDDTGSTVHAPLRMTHTDQLGIAFELGPYSISTEDVIQLGCVIEDYLARVKWSTGC